MNLKDMPFIARTQLAKWSFEAGSKTRTNHADLIKNAQLMYKNNRTCSTHNVTH